MTISAAQRLGHDQPVFQAVNRMTTLMLMLMLTLISLMLLIRHSDWPVGRED